MKNFIYFTILFTISHSLCFCQTAEEFYKEGESSYLNREYQKAIPLFTKAIELEPNKSKFYSLRGVAKYHLQDYRGVITDLTKAIELEDFKTPQLYFFIGRAKYELQDYQGAITDFTKSIELDYGSGAYYHRGLAKLGLEQKDSGCLDLSKAGELGHPEAYDAIKKLCK